MKIARTLVVGEETEKVLSEDFGAVIFVESEDELWRQLLAWQTFSALEDFSFQNYLANLTLVVCPSSMPKRSFRRLKREIALESFNYPIKVVRGFPHKPLFNIFQKEDFKRGFRQVLWNLACKVFKNEEINLEILIHYLKRCPFCEKEALEVINELAELKRKLKLIYKEQWKGVISGWFYILLKCSACKEVIFRQPHIHFYRVPVESFLTIEGEDI